MSILGQIKSKIKLTLRSMKRDKLRKKYENSSLDQVFTDIHDNHRWRSEESVSGKGSTMDNTVEVRKQLPVLIREMGIETMLDAPCGDYNWLKTVDLGLKHYEGSDIVASLVDKNKETFASDNVSFSVLDITQGPVGKYDVIMCRDCLVHLSFDYVKKAIHNFKSSGSKYLLVTTFSKLEQNEDIVPGMWRALNMEKPPFNFPKPVRVIEEKITSGSPLQFNKCLSLYELDAIPES